MSLKSGPSKVRKPINPPDVCGKCQGARGPAKYAVRVTIYLLEDLPLAAYYFDLCEHCMREQSRLAKKQAIKTNPLDHTNE